MEIIDGKAISQEIKDELKEKVVEFKKRYNRDITLAVVMAGNNPASAVYVKNKIKATEYIGIKSISCILKENATQKEVESEVKRLAKDDSIDGILVQLPLPNGIDGNKVLSLIPPQKDVDGFTAINVGNLLLGKDCIVSCTPKGIITLLKRYNIELTGKHAVIVGRSNIVGKPMSLLLLKENCTVTVCHSKTIGLKEICCSADILVAAIGKAKFITADMVKQGAVVIDVGINRTENGLVGDVDFEGVKDKVSYITPVPGGVGPMTIASLMQNTFICAEKRAKGEK